MHEESLSYPLVTVIALSYNSGEYIFEAISSVLEQTYPKIELIISDDGSEDFQESRICDFLNAGNKGNVFWKIIQNKENIGTVRNLNGAIKASHGEIIFLLAADDAYDNEHVIFNWVEAFRVTGSEAMTSYVKMCGTSLDDINFVLPSNDNLKQLSSLSPAQLYIPHILAVFDGYISPIPSGGAMAYSRDCIERYGLFDETYFLMEDYPAIETLLRHGVQITLWENVSFRHREGGVSSGFKFNKILGFDFYLYRKAVIKTVFQNDLGGLNVRSRMLLSHFVQSILYLCQVHWNSKIFGLFSLSEIRFVRFFVSQIYRIGRYIWRKRILIT